MDFATDFNRPTWTRRLSLGALALSGQVAGILCTMVLSSIIGIASHVVPVLGSATMGAILFPLLFVGCPILGAWAFLKPAAGEIRPLAVSTTSYLFAGLLFLWTARAMGVERRAIGAMLLPWLVLLPLASILGSLLGSYIRPGRREKVPDNNALHLTGGGGKLDAARR